MPVCVRTCVRVREAVCLLVSVLLPLLPLQLLFHFLGLLFLFLLVFPTLKQLLPSSCGYHLRLLTFQGLLLPLSLLHPHIFSDSQAQISFWG